jgi:hypothetical protein
MMTINTLPIVQLPLFLYGEPTGNIAEMLPVVWNATECLASENAITRQHGIDAILELGAQKVSPLVGFMIATRLGDKDIYIRRRVIYILADLITWVPGDDRRADNIRKSISNYLHDIGEETILGILEVAVMDPQAEKAVYDLLNACPFAGRFLGDILTEWKHPLAIRQKAIHFVGLVGYMEILPVLERLLDRLEARQTGQYTMSFASSSARSDEDIMPYLRIAIKNMSAG